MFGVQIPAGGKYFPLSTPIQTGARSSYQWCSRGYSGRGLAHLMPRSRLPAAQFVGYNVLCNVGCNLGYNVGRDWVLLWRQKKQQRPYQQHSSCMYVRDTRSVSWDSQSLDRTYTRDRPVRFCWCTRLTLVNTMASCKATRLEAGLTHSTVSCWVANSCREWDPLGRRKQVITWRR